MFLCVLYCVLFCGMPDSRRSASMQSHPAIEVGRKVDRWYPAWRRSLCRAWRFPGYCVYGLYLYVYSVYCRQEDCVHVSDAYSPTNFPLRWFFYSALLYGRFCSASISSFHAYDLHRMNTHQCWLSPVYTGDYTLIWRSRSICSRWNIVVKLL